MAGLHIWSTSHTGLEKRVSHASSGTAITALRPAIPDSGKSMQSRTAIVYQDKFAIVVEEITFDEDVELCPTCEPVLLPCVG
jgi:hypothetical protein